MSVLRRLFRRPSGSRSLARDRLERVVVHDRAGLNPEIMDELQEALVETLSRYVEIDREQMAITLSRGEGCTRLLADIPLRRPPTANL